jgi:hypothetical protein
MRRAQDDEHMMARVVKKRSGREEATPMDHLVARIIKKGDIDNLVARKDKKSFT